MAILESPVLSPPGGVCEGVEHALPDFVGWGVDARGRERVLDVRAKERIDLGESSFNFSYLDAEVLHLGVATLFKFAPCDRPVGSEPPKHNAAVEEFADRVEALRRETPVNGYRAPDPFQGLNEGCGRCAGAEKSIPCGRQSVSVQYTRFFNVKMQKTLLLFQPPAEGGFA